MYTLPYFLDKIDIISEKDYIPSTEDILRTQSHTRGQSAATLTVSHQKEKHVFEIVDVGGQKAERKKWFQYMDTLAAIIYVSSLSSYCQMSYDTYENAFIESLTVFEETINSKHLRKFDCILFLNKEDLFEECLSTIKYKDPLDEYKGNNENKFEIIDYVKEQFTKRAKQQQSSRRSLHFHVTTAFNKSNVTNVFKNVQLRLLKNSIAQGGFDF